jgi:hypothetical protein
MGKGLTIHLQKIIEISNIRKYPNFVFGYDVNGQIIDYLFIYV